MKLIGIIIALVVLHLCFSVSAVAGENNYTQISETFFPLTKNWSSLENAPPIEKVKFTAIKDQLKKIFLSSRISEKLEDKDCSFINRALEGNDLNSFRLIDADSDGKEDIFYTGQLNVERVTYF
jgi:hypothetical protein